MSKTVLGRPRKSESEKRSFRQNFRLNRKEMKILKSVPRKNLTARWCYLLELWDKNRLVLQ